MQTWTRDALNEGGADSDACATLDQEGEFRYPNGTLLKIICDDPAEFHTHNREGAQPFSKTVPPNTELVITGAYCRGIRQYKNIRNLSGYLVNFEGLTLKIPLSALDKYESDGRKKYPIVAKVGGSRFKKSRKNCRRGRRSTRRY